MQTHELFISEALCGIYQFLIDAGYEPVVDYYQLIVSNHQYTFTISQFSDYIELARDRGFGNPIGSDLQILWNGLVCDPQVLEILARELQTFMDGKPVYGIPKAIDTK